MGTHSVCHSYHLLAPTRTMSCTAYSYVQRELRQPQFREICHLPKNMLCQYKTSPQLGISRNIFEVSHSQRRNRKLLCPQLPISNCSALSQRLKGRHTEKSRVRLQKTQRSALQKTGYKALNAKRSLSQQQASRCVQTCFLYRGKCILVCPASSAALVA